VSRYSCIKEVFCFFVFLICASLLMCSSVYAARYWSEKIKETASGWLTRGAFRADQQTDDGGFIAIDSLSGYNAKVIKFKSNGEVEWSRKVTNNNTWIHGIKQTDDGGYIVVGDAKGSDDAQDVWIMKLDSTGTLEWQKSFSAGEYFHCLAEAVALTNDGGYIVTGYYKNLGPGDVLLIRLSAEGDLVWARRYGKSYSVSSYSHDPIDDHGYSVQQTDDGGFVVAGYTSSFGAGNMWRRHFLIMKVDSFGNFEWGKEFGGYGTYDVAYSVRETDDGGFIVGGTSDHDAWILKLKDDGGMVWSKTLQSGKGYYLRSVIPASDGGFIVGGTYTDSDFNADGWIAEFSADGELEWQKLYGDEIHHQVFYDVERASRGFVVAGYDREEPWILKLDGNGNIPDCNIVRNFTASVEIGSGPSGNDIDIIQYDGLEAADTVRDLTSLDMEAVQGCYHESPNVPPVISSISANPGSGVAPLTVSLVCEATDSDGSIESYEFDFGDGTDLAISDGNTVTHTYDNSGEYQATCTVYDNEGASDTSEPVTVTVNEPVPGWHDITEGVNVRRSRPLYDRMRHCFFVYVTLTNVSGTEMAGPVRMVLESSTIPIINNSSSPGMDPDGYTDDGKPYFITVPENETWTDGESLGQIRLDFKLRRQPLDFELKFEGQNEP